MKKVLIAAALLCAGLAPAETCRNGSPLPAADAAVQAKCAAGPAPLVSEVKPFGGAPCLFIDGKPETGLMHWNRVMTPADVAVFRDAGIHLYSFMGAPEMPAPDGGETSYADGFAHMPILTPAYLDRTLSMIERADPAAKVLVRLRLTTPDWWRRAHSNETVRAWDVVSRTWKTRPWASPSSPSWRALMDAAMRRIVRHCEAKWPHRVVGYHPGLGCCAENAYDWGKTIADYSPCHVRDFPEPVPPPETYLPRNFDDVRSLLDPVREANAAHFMRFQNERMADAACFLASAVKDELRRLGRRKVCGAFYGYFCFPANQMEFHGSGHRDFARVLACPDVDFVCAPVDYGARPAGCTALAQTLPAAIALHGKLYYAEEDTRFHTAQAESDCVSGDAATTRALLRRNFLDTFARGGSIWWMDLFGKGWYRDKWFVPELAACRRFAERHLQRRSSAAQIAVFVSETSIDWERLTPLALSQELVGMTLSELAACGAPYDLYLLSDVPLLAEKGLLERYRLAVLPNASAPNAAERGVVSNHLCRAGRTVVFLGMPGYVVPDGASPCAGAAASSRFTSIVVAETPSRNAGIVEAFPEGRRISFGAARKRAPALTVSDAAVEDVGWFVQGADRCHPKKARGVAVARKRLDGWTSVVALTTTLPSELFRLFAQDAGVHVYSHHGDQVFAGEGWFAVAAKMPGKHVFYAKENPSRPIAVDLKRGETWLWPRFDVSLEKENAQAGKDTAQGL